MKTTLYWFGGIAFVLGLLAVLVALLPKGQARVGLSDGRLSPCPNTPNCVGSEDHSASHYISPLSFEGSAAGAWQRARQSVTALGGMMQKEEQGYLWASFTTKWLRFVDDLELRMDAGAHVIHVRSASRVGRSDFGVNRQRVEMLRALFNNNDSMTSDPQAPGNDFP